MKLIHLAQTHSPSSTRSFGWSNGEIVFTKVNDEVTFSQLKIAMYLIQHTPTHVMLEGADDRVARVLTDLTPELRWLIKENFKHGIPHRVELLSETQQGFLNSFGGATVALALGFIKRVYRSTTTKMEEICTENSGGETPQFDPISCIYMYEEREKEAMTCVQDIIFDDDPDEIILIYGRGHNFYPYCTEFGYDYERIETCSPPYMTKKSVMPAQAGNHF